jgi:hypothetical protein
MLTPISRYCYTQGLHIMCTVTKITPSIDFSKLKIRAKFNQTSTSILCLRVYYVIICILRMSPVFHASEEMEMVLTTDQFSNDKESDSLWLDLVLPITAPTDPHGTIPRHHTIFAIYPQINSLPQLQ